MDGQNKQLTIVISCLRRTALLERCLDSLAKQTQKLFEVIIVTKENFDLSDLFDKDTNIKIIKSTLSKSASRNLGINSGTGEYILYLDEDMVLAENVVRECLKEARTGVAALIIPEEEEAANNFYNATRRLEKEIANNDEYIQSPRFMRRDIFEKIGGFNEQLDPIDEGDIREKLNEQNIKIGIVNTYITIVKDNRNSNLRKRFKDFIARGKKIKLFKAYHPRSAQFSVSKRFKNYFDLRGFVKRPSCYFVLIILKALDLLFLKIGSLLTTTADTVEIARLRNRNVFNQEGADYQSEFYEKSRGGSYVNKRETACVLNLLKNIKTEKFTKIIDIGAGGGRWSELFLNEFPVATITAVDLSESMIQHIKKNIVPKYSNRLMVLKSNMEEIDLPNSDFDFVFSFRAIKYSPQQKEVIHEISLLLKRGGVTIIEFPYPNAIYLILKRLNFLNNDYLKRIYVYKPTELNEMFKCNGLTVKSKEFLFKLPATLYKRINNTTVIAVLSFVEKLLPSAFFTRSIVICAIKL